MDYYIHKKRGDHVEDSVKICFVTYI